MPTSGGLLAAAGGLVATTSYLDAKLRISKDLKFLSRIKRAEQNLLAAKSRRQPFQYVGIYMLNSLDFLFIWLGLLSIGAAPALVNYNLASGALVHCVKISGTKLLFYDCAPDCAARIEASAEELRALGVELILLDATLKTELDGYPTERPETTCFEDSSTAFPLRLMYTSKLIRDEHALWSEAAQLDYQRHRL
ncbi:hypothetical protein E4U61_002094 [Claviceps capensis]|nr:hypothetical protein E4U61_002094 [Claviceps capensis]